MKNLSMLPPVSLSLVNVAIDINSFQFKDAHLGLRQFRVTESPLKPWEIQNIKFKIYIFSNIWISKVNQTMIFGQLIEYNMINIFFQKSCAKFCGKTILRTIFKNIKRKHISGSTVWSFIQFFSIVFQNWGLLKHIETNCLNFFN